MSWSRLDDGFYDHPKARRTDLAALGLWVKALSYAGRHLTDGRIELADVEDLSRLPRASAQKLAAKLVESGLWNQDQDGAYRIHDYLEYNPTRAKTLKDRADDAERKRRSRNPESGRFGSDVRPDSARNPSGVRQESQGSPVHPVPARPGPKDFNATANAVTVQDVLPTPPANQDDFTIVSDSEEAATAAAKLGFVELTRALVKAPARPETLAEQRANLARKQREALEVIARLGHVNGTGEAKA